jgi:hypothetical protein
MAKNRSISGKKNRPFPGRFYVIPDGWSFVPKPEQLFAHIGTPCTNLRASVRYVVYGVYRNIR